MLNVELMINIIMKKHSFKYIKEDDIRKACNKFKNMKDIPSAVDCAMKDLDNTNKIRAPKSERKSLTSILDFTNTWR